MGPPPISAQLSKPGGNDGRAWLTVDHSTIARWVLRYAPVLNERIRSEMRNPNRSWRLDETYIRVAGQWTYLYRAVDSAGNTNDFLLSRIAIRLPRKAFSSLRS